MNGVIGMTGLLLDTPLNNEQKEYVETIRTSGEALLSIINDILDFSKIDAGMLAFEKVDFDLCITVETGVELFAEQAQRKGVELLHHIDDDTPNLLRGDPGRLRQILTNLVNNAVKFTSQGEVLVCVSKQNETETHVTLRFEVKDTGIGISKEELSRLFQPFSQADTSTTRKYGGTGLGLVICKKLVEAMNGQIGAESTWGKGSTFWFTAEFEKQTSPVEETVKIEPQLEGLRVLIVDDNATNRKIIHHQIISWKMRNGMASSAAEALTILRREATAGDPYDFVILDMQMPEMDGMMLARAIKADTSIAQTHLIMMSSVGGRGEVEKTKQSGIDAYLTKPVRPSVLFDSLIRVIASSPRSVQHFRTRESPISALGKSRAKILVVEDNPINQKVLIRQLEKLGFSPELAADGKEALDKVTREKYDLVFMDCQMPEMDGYQTTREIRKREGTSKHTKIIAMTAHALPGDREKCLAAGMDDYLSKPIDQIALGKKIREIGLSITAGPQEKPRLNFSSFPLLKKDERLFKEMAELFLQYAPGQFSDVKKSIQQSDAKLLERTAHTLKGSIAHIVKGKAFELASQLEQIGQSGNLENALPLCNLLEEEIDQIKQALLAYQRRI